MLFILQNYFKHQKHIKRSKTKSLPLVIPHRKINKQIYNLFSGVSKYYYIHIKKQTNKTT